MTRFTLPRDLYHGKGSLEALKTLEGKKAIICVGGGSMKRNGFLQKAEDYLKEAGMEVKLFEGIESDPSVDTVNMNILTLHLKKCARYSVCRSFVKKHISVQYLLHPVQQRKLRHSQLSQITKKVLSIRWLILNSHRMLQS